MTAAMYGDKEAVDMLMSLYKAKLIKKVQFETALRGYQASRDDIENENRSIIRRELQIDCH